MANSIQHFTNPCASSSVDYGFAFCLRTSKCTFETREQYEDAVKDELIEAIAYGQLTLTEACKILSSKGISTEGFEL